MSHLVNLRIAAALLVAATAACTDAGTAPNDDLGDPTTTTSLREYGPAQALGNGRARAYVAIDPNGGQPLELGVALDSAALAGLPAAMPPMPEMPAGHEDMHEYRLTLPANAPKPYTFVELDWNPQGHGEPYTQPHFDFHFYTISLAERDAIDPADPQWAAKASRFPDADYIRPSFACPCTLLNVPAPAMAVPRMGLHWLDVTAPELRGAPFTTTMINGTWDGKVIFQEPMITRDFILSRAAKGDTTIALAQAKRANPAGWYPAQYGVSYDAATKEFRIALAKMAWLQ